MSTKQTLIDEQSALTALSGDRKLLCELAAMYVEDAPNLLHQLEKAIEQQDFPAARRTLHSLRGLSLTYYASEVIHSAIRLEQDLDNDKVDSPPCEGLAGLKCSIESLIQELRSTSFKE